MRLLEWGTVGGRSHRPETARRQGAAIPCRADRGTCLGGRPRGHSTLEGGSTPGQPADARGEWKYEL